MSAPDDDISFSLALSSYVSALSVARYASGNPITPSEFFSALIMCLQSVLKQIPEGEDRDRLFHFFVVTAAESCGVEVITDYLPAQHGGLN